MFMGEGETDTYREKWAYRDFQARIYEVALKAYQQAVKAYREWLSDDYKSGPELEYPLDGKVLSKDERFYTEPDQDMKDLINRLLDPDKEEETGS